MDLIDLIKERESICEQYVEDYQPNDDSDEIIGRVGVEIVGFGSLDKYLETKWAVMLETDWGEVITWEFGHDSFHSTWVSTLCDETDTPYSEFDTLVGERVWMDVKSVGGGGEETVLKTDEELLFEK